MSNNPRTSNRKTFKRLRSTAIVFLSPPPQPPAPSLIGPENNGHYNVVGTFDFSKRNNYVSCWLFFTVACEFTKSSNNDRGEKMFQITQYVQCVRFVLNRVLRVCGYGVLLCTRVQSSPCNPRASGKRFCQVYRNSDTKFIYYTTVRCIAKLRVANAAAAELVRVSAR